MHRIAAVKNTPAGDGHQATYSISQLAREFDITPRTIRFYEDKGLLSPRRAGTTRIYNGRDRVRLKLVLRGKRLGFSLREIADIIDMYDSEPGEVGQLEYMLRRLEQRRSLLQARRRDIELTLQELDQLESQCRSRLSSMRRQRVPGGGAGSC
jgi:DNA-binding transcriptional MerR regulator